MSAGRCSWSTALSSSTSEPAGCRSAHAWRFDASSLLLHARLSNGCNRCNRCNHCNRCNRCNRCALGSLRSAHSCCNGCNRCNHCNRCALGSPHSAHSCCNGCNRFNHCNRCALGSPHSAHSCYAAARLCSMSSATRRTAAPLATCRSACPPLAALLAAGTSESRPRTSSACSMKPSEPRTPR